ncbi:MAG: 4a-hydroxytetrahydrobiopterin dehydratase [Hyphomonadaceae bacterium]|nr:4a-hydroxytetrahydrobiopterin dehydratase [Hyphomonadaceae bacterium]
MTRNITRIGAQAAIESLAGWSVVDGRDAIFKSFKFADFKAALAFIVQTGLKAEQMDHHPEWFNVYNRVDVTLATHDADGVTVLDVELAGFMDAVAARG